MDVIWFGEAGETQNGGKVPEEKDTKREKQKKSRKRELKLVTVRRLDENKRKNTGQKRGRAPRPAEKKRPEVLFVPKGIAERTKEDRSAFIAEIPDCLVKAAVVFVFLVLLRDEVPSTARYAAFWYIFSTLFQLALGSLCRCVGSRIGKKERLWAAYQTVSRGYEYWEWYLTAYGEKWRTVAFALTCLVPGFAAVFLSFKITPVPLWFSGVVLVAGTVAVVLKRWDDAWEELVVPYWSVTWQLDQKVKKQGVS